MYAEHCVCLRPHTRQYEKRLGQQCETCNRQITTQDKSMYGNHDLEIQTITSEVNQKDELENQAGNTII